MATIITKNSTGSGVIPSSLIQGELAINVKDGRLFYGSGSGNVVKEFSTNTGSLLTTASVSLNTITFTKGDGSTFPITVNTGSGGGGSTFPYTGSAIISGSLTVTGSFYVSKSIDSVNKHLIDNTSVISLDWNGRGLRDSTGLGSVDWENRITYDSAGGESINWDIRRINDSSTALSIQYEDRQLIANDGSTPALDWRTVDTLTVIGHLIPGGTITNNTSSYDLGSATAAWRDLYVSNGSINLISGSQSASISFTNGALDFGTTPISSPDVIATASVSSNTITFTKGDGTTFPITVDTGSAGGVSKSFLVSIHGATVGASATQYAAFGVSGFNASESARIFVIPYACTMKNFYVRIFAAQPSTGALTLTLRNNSVDTPVAVTIAAGSAAGTEANSNTSSTSFIAGDNCSIRVTNAASTTSGTVHNTSILVEI